MDGGGGEYVSPIWYYDFQAQNHDALFLTGHFIVLFSIHVVSSVHKSIFVFGTIRIKTVCTSIIVHNKCWRKWTDLFGGGGDKNGIYFSFVNMNQNMYIK